MRAAKAMKLKMSRRCLSTSLRIKSTAVAKSMNVLSQGLSMHTGTFCTMKAGGMTDPP